MNDVKTETPQDLDVTSRLLVEREGYRQLAINAGWSHRLADAYGREEYARERAAEVDRGLANRIEKGWDLAAAGLPIGPADDGAAAPTLTEKALRVLEGVKWQMDNFVPAEGESARECRDRRLVTAIASALADEAAGLRGMMIALAGRGTQDRTDGESLRRRIVDHVNAGNGPIDIDLEEWTTILGALSR